MVDTAAPVASLQFVAFDFETTGLYAGRDQIVEFGAVRFQGDKVLGQFQELVDPGVTISPEITKVSGITSAMVKGKPSGGVVLPRFLEFLGDAILVAHNADFDVGFLRAAIQVNQCQPITNLIIDTVGLAKRAFPGQKSYSLQNLAAFLRFPPNQAHRALDDSIMCMRLFLACTQALSFMGDISLAEVIA